MRPASKGRILLINPWITDFAAYDFWLKPLGLLCIASTLDRNGYDVVLLDCMDRFRTGLLPEAWDPIHTPSNRGTGRFFKEILNKPEILASIRRRFGRYGLPISRVERYLQTSPSPDAVFITSGMTYWYPGVFEMISLVKHHFPRIPVVLGGIYATLCTEHARRFSGADFVVRGEGELKALRYADELCGHGPDGEVDDNPIPLYALYKKLSTAAVLTSRGCPHRCRFCAAAVLHPSYRRRPPDSVIEEIIRLHESKGVEHIAFYDDALLHQKEAYFIPILRALAKRRLPLRFHTPNGLQPREIDSDLALWMRKARFETLRLSFETINVERRSLMDDKVVPADVEQAVRVFIEAGFEPRNIGCYILAGLPDQTIEEVVESMRFIYGLGVRSSLSFFSPIPGTPVFEEAVERGLLPAHSDPLLTNNTVFPVWSGIFSQEACFGLSALSAAANDEIVNGRSPLQTERIVRMMEDLLSCRDA